MFDVVLAGGRVVDGTGSPWFRADVGIRGDRIAAVGALGRAEARRRLDVPTRSSRRASSTRTSTATWRSWRTRSTSRRSARASRPTSSARTASRWPRRRRRRSTTCAATRPASAGASTCRIRWSSMAEYLARFDRRAAVNVACLVPNGNVRMEVMGLETRPPTADELGRMRRIVREAMEQGAVGLSSGLDYIPSRYAQAEELAALCQEIAPYGGVYVTHMRRYDARRRHRVDGRGLPHRPRGRRRRVHISHFNSRADLVLPHLDRARAAGLDVTFDLYCYLAGSDHPRHDRAAAVGAGGRRRRDARAAGRPGGPRPAPGRGLRRAAGGRSTRCA